MTPASPPLAPNPFRAPRAPVMPMPALWLGALPLRAPRQSIGAVAPDGRRIH